MKCWICGTEYLEADCPKCGPPQPWGPTPEELADDADDFRDEEQRYWFWDDNDYAEMVCVKRWGEI